MSARGEIENTLYRLAWGTDRRDIEYITSSYSHDAHWVREATPNKERLILEGRDQIAAHLQSAWAKTPPPISKHAITNILIARETDQEAEVTSYKTAVRIVDGKPVVASSGWYRDRFVNESGTWRIKERILFTDGEI